MAYQHPGNPLKHRFEGMERISVAEYYVNVKDAFNLPYVYLMIHDWLMEEGWGGSGDADFGEKMYTHRDHPTFGREIWIRWRLQKSPADKSKLFHYTMDLDWHILGLKNTEIVWQGQKVETNKGEFEVQCRAAIVIDKEKQWTKWPFSSFKDLYLKRALRQKLLVHKKTLYADAYRFRDLMMNYLKMETFMPLKEAGEFYVKRTFE